MTDQDTLGFHGTTSRAGVEFVEPALPKWALALIDEVLAEQGHPGVRPRKIIWEMTRARHFERTTQTDLWGVEHVEYTERIVQGTGSSGWTRVGWSGPGSCVIKIRAGTDLDDLRMVILHELAHSLLPPGESHGRTFWAKAWELYYRYTPTREGIALIARREAGYKRASVKAHREAENSLWTVRGQTDEPG